ncbi:MAG: glutathione S-transferase family protein [Nitrincola lacisaponensis]|uniref:glutathione S-transferase family protein n=1 Tax=Nitrincola lacisaponensis TaxID=267850 RepID=UPI00391DC801
MGLLKQGQWFDEWYDTESNDGEFIRTDAQFRHWITTNGAAGPSGDSGFNAESGRYHLYVSLACPWAHRTLIFRQLKQLQPHITLSIVNPYMAEQGWTFKPAAGSTHDHLFGYDFLHQLYTRAQSDYSGRVTVPVLYDKQRDTIVSNESAEIIRMLNSAFNDITGNRDDYLPSNHLKEIDAINARVLKYINNGVYRAGFATRQDAYEAAVIPLFELLESLEEHLATQRYLLGAQVTEADWRLFTTLIRFDPVYHGHFKCNLKRIADLPALHAYMRELYQWPGIAETVDFAQIKTHYYASHQMINPTRIVPVGPEQHLWLPHGREQLQG